MEKRRQLIVNPKVQYRLLVVIMSVAMAPVTALFIGFSVYMGILVEKIPAENPDVVALVHSIQVLSVLTFASFIVILIVLAIVEMKFLHKIMGPLFRVETDLEEILNTGNFEKHIEIRKGDYLHSVIVKINALIDRAGSK